MIRKAVYFIALAVLALGVIGIQLDRQTYRDPQLASVVPGPFRGVAQQRLLELQDGVETFQSDARHLVRLRPLPARHLLLFAQAAETAGERDTALAALEVAAARGWREPGPQLAVAQASVLLGNYELASQRLAALSATGAAPEQTDALLRTMMMEEGGRDALANLLVGEGSWKRWFIQRLRETGPDEQFVDIIDLAWERSAILDCSQIRPTAIRHLNEHRTDLAERLWQGNCANQTLSAS